LQDILELVLVRFTRLVKNYKAKTLGYFSARPKSKQRKYVSRIERHGIFNSGHFRQLFDVLIEMEYSQRKYFCGKWLEIFKENKENW
jgi:hypothetical protein